MPWQRLGFGHELAPARGRVIYGTSEMDAKLRVAVDASTGTFLKVEK